MVMLTTDKAQSSQLIYQKIKSVFGETINKPILEFTTNETYIRNSVLMNSGMAATNSQSKNKFFELYIISNDEIKGGWVYNVSIDKIQNVEIAEKEFLYLDNGLKVSRKYCNKIISSTDKSITPDSWTPESFIITYIKSFNESKPITEVDLEIEIFSTQCPVERIKTSPDGSVIIHQAKMYSREEVIKLLKDFDDAGGANIDVDKWIEENLI